MWLKALAGLGRAPVMTLEGPRMQPMTSILMQQTFGGPRCRLWTCSMDEVPADMHTHDEAMLQGPSVPSDIQHMQQGMA